MKKYMESKGFEVISAATPEQARLVLERRSLDLAVLDLRLSNDADERDIGGLELAQMAQVIRPSVPIIIYSSYPTRQVVRDVFAADVELPSAAYFVSKAEGQDALLELSRRMIAHAELTKESSLQSLQVFLCHSSKDKLRIKEVYDRLRSDGLDPWLDKENLLPGQNWELEIKKAVRNSDIVIVCLSQSSVSQRGFIQKEIKLALDVADEQPEGTIFIIPLKLEECDIPERPRQWHWLNYWEDDAHEKLLLSLKHRASEISPGRR
jgi:ActR/RegA family two-component response regulator